MLHHTKYIETHGIDETVELSKSDHKQIDHRLLFPNYTVAEISKFSQRAFGTLEYRKENIENYKKRNLEKIIFDEALMPYVLLREELRYNKHTGVVYCTSSFAARHNKSLFYIEAY